MEMRTSLILVCLICYFPARTEVCSNILALKDKISLWNFVGRYLSMLPVDPKLGKMLIMGAVFHCIDPVLTVVAGLSVRDPFLLPQDKKDVSLWFPMLDFISVTDIGYELNLCFLKSLMRKIKDDLVLKNALWYFLLSNNLIMQMRFFFISYF